MIRNRRPVSAALLAAGLIAVIAAAWTSASGTAAAQTPSPAPAAAPASDVLQVSSVSPWVGPEGVFEVDFAPTNALPAGATFNFTIHQALRTTGQDTLRAQVDAILDGGSPGRTLQASVSEPIANLGDPAQGLAFRLPVRSQRGDAAATLLPNAGIHPIELEVAGADGAPVWRQTVFLNHLPAADPAVPTGQVAVKLVLALDTGPALSNELTPSIGIDERADVSSAESLYAAVPDAPFSLALRPNTLDALSRSTETNDRHFVESLALGRPSTVIDRLPYVRVDVGGLIAAGASDEMGRQLLTGAQVVDKITGTVPDGHDWILDDTVSADSLAFLRNSGVRRIIVPADRLRIPTSLPPETAWTRTMGLGASDGMTVTSYDQALTSRLAAAAIPPAVRAHQVVTDLMATWFSASEDAADRFPGPSSIVVVPPGTDPEVIRQLATALAINGPISTAAAAVPTSAARDRGHEIVATLAPRAPSNQGDVVADARETDRMIGGYRSMVGTADPVLEGWDRLVDQSLSVAMGQAERASSHGHIRAEINARLAAVEPPPSRRVVITGNSASIPLRFRNGNNTDVRLLMRTRSARLEFQNGNTQSILLHPGENRIDLAVSVRAPGASLLRIDLRSPDGSLTLSDTSVPVQSSRISGVGFALSVVSLLVLLLWWVRTYQRRKRSSTRESGRHPSTEQPSEPPPAAEDATTAPSEVSSGGPHDG